MATIYGSFSSYSTSIYRPYITYSVASQDIPNNQSTITWTLYFAKYNASYFAYNASFSCSINVNGVVFSGSESFDLRDGSVPEIEAIRSGTTVVTHNSDGTKSIWIGASGDTGASPLLGTFNFGQTVALPTIPREAGITSSSNLTIGNNLSYTLSNPGGLYCRLEFWINGNAGWYKVLDSQRGTGSSGTLSFGTTENNAMYSRMPSVTSASCKLRVYTYSDAGYSTQVGSYDDQDGTVSINQATNKPVFTTYTIANLDKTVTVKDKYDNILTTSSTDTLLNSQNKVIKGYSKVRATISSANKMVAQNYATEVKYRLTGTGSKDENYSTGDVTIDLDNQQVVNFTLTAYDSRSLTTAVSGSIPELLEYENVSLWAMKLVRDNGVDSETKLQISGSYWANSFGTTGVTNTVTAHYRYKETTEAWGAQTWNSLTLTDTSGSLSFDDYINGDLGATGFDTEKSFDIEVRIYDKLSATIVEATLNVGIPVMEITPDGVAFGERYDETEGGSIQLLGQSILNIMYPIGSIYINASDSTNPATLMGFGTWTAFGSGRVPVGYNSGDTDFNAGEKTGGSKTVNLQHSHTQGTLKAAIGAVNGDSGALGYQPTSAISGVSYNNNYGVDGASPGTISTVNHATPVYGSTANSGSTTQTIVQPYITVYMWKRTA